MATKIEWCDETINPIRTKGGGWHCVRKLEGCRNCYAESVNRRFGNNIPYNRSTPFCEKDFEFTFKPFLSLPKKPKRVFVQSMSDLFLEEHSYQLIDNVFEHCSIHDRHQYVFLTKRIENALKYFDSTNARCDGLGSNMLFGISVSTQEEADKYIPLLLKMRTFSKCIKLAVSIEPMLGPVDLTQYLPNTWHCDYCGKRFPDGFYCGCEKDDCDCSTDDFKCPDCGWDREAFNPLWPGAYDKNDFPSLDWVICGGESGPGARPMHSDWARSVRDQCQEAGVPFFLKQMVINGKMVKLPGLDGKQWREFPNAI